jgi:integrase
MWRVYERRIVGTLGLNRSDLNRIAVLIRLMSMSIAHHEREDAVPSVRVISPPGYSPNSAFLSLPSERHSATHYNPRGKSTLRRIFGKARKDWKVIHDSPKVNLLEERERTLLLDEVAEKQMLAVAEQPLADIIKLMRDLGVRNGKELYPLRVEHINWRKQLVRVPDSKTKAGERLVPLSHRAEEILRDRCGDRKQGWVFPSCRKGTHITSGLVNKQWVRARKKAGLPKDLVLYCGRHDYGTEMAERTGNLKAVMEVMGHVDVKTAMKYQHPGLRVVGDAIRARS